MEPFGVAATVEAFEPGGLRVGVRWQQPDGGAAHTMCREMVFLSDLDTVERWRRGAPDRAGLFDLNEAVEFGVRFSVPLISDDAR